LDREVDVMPASIQSSPDEGSDRRAGGVDSADELGEVAPLLQRRGVFPAVSIQEARHGLKDDLGCFVVAVRTIETEWRDRGYHDPRPALGERVVGDSKLREASGTPAFDDDV